MKSKDLPTAPATAEVAPDDDRVEQQLAAEEWQLALLESGAAIREKSQTARAAAIAQQAEWLREQELELHAQLLQQSPEIPVHIQDLSLSALTARPSRDEQVNLLRRQCIGLRRAQLQQRERHADEQAKGLVAAAGLLEQRHLQLAQAVAQRQATIKKLYEQPHGSAAVPLLPELPQMPPSRAPAGPSSTMGRVATAQLGGQATFRESSAMEADGMAHMPRIGAAVSRAGRSSVHRHASGPHMIAQGGEWREEQAPEFAAGLPHDLPDAPDHLADLPDDLPDAPPMQGRQQRMPTASFTASLLLAGMQLTLGQLRYDAERSLLQVSVPQEPMGMADNELLHFHDRLGHEQHLPLSLQRTAHEAGRFLSWWSVAEWTHEEASQFARVLQQLR